ncbi:MAG: hypothetical protein JWP95_245, partial [Actinotalea sp.]|nr:hypothetical protein [Actinotalea sp.]
MSHEATPGTAHPHPDADRTDDDIWTRNLLDSSNEVIFFKDLQSRVIRVSLGCAVLHHRTQDEMIGLADTDLFDRAHAGPAYADEQR